MLKNEQLVVSTLFNTAENELSEVELLMTLAIFDELVMNNIMFGLFRVALSKRRGKKNIMSLLVH